VAFRIGIFGGEIMAINLITAPTAGAPIDTDDYDAQNTYLQALINWGHQTNRFLTEWETLSEPEIADGIYIMHGGALYLVDGDESISGSPSDGRVYVKVEDSGSDTLDVSFVNSASGYSWNDIYNGFYHADGSQLLPVICALDSTNWYKFDLSGISDRFDIASDYYYHTVEEIGAWNMDDSADVIITASVPDDFVAVEVCAIIRGDSGDDDAVLKESLEGLDSSQNPKGYIQTSANEIELYRYSGGRFDDALWSSILINRGWISCIFKF
jgi:hypothetical protein